MNRDVMASAWGLLVGVYASALRLHSYMPWYWWVLATSAIVLLPMRLYLLPGLLKKLKR